jgi:hypothetical protein
MSLERWHEEETPEGDDEAHMGLAAARDIHILPSQHQKTGTLHDSYSSYYESVRGGLGPGFAGIASPDTTFGLNVDNASTQDTSIGQWSAIASVGSESSGGLIVSFRSYSTGPWQDGLHTAHSSSAQPPPGSSSSFSNSSDSQDLWPGKIR